jgi:hypothetical protein
LSKEGGIITPFEIDYKAVDLNLFIHEKGIKIIGTSTRVAYRDMPFGVSFPQF